VVQIPVQGRNFPPHHCVQIGSRAHPASYPMSTMVSFSLGVKRPDREADHSPPSSAEVNNAWNSTSTPPIRLHGLVLIKKAQVRLYFYLYSDLLWAERQGFHFGQVQGFLLRYRVQIGSGAHPHPPPSIQKVPGIFPHR